MLMSIPFFTFVVLASCGSIIGAPGQPQNTTMTLTRRQTNNPAMSQNGGMKSILSTGAQKVTNMGGANGTPVEMTDLEKEAKEAAEEKKPGMNTIANAIKELYFHDKYGSQRYDTVVLVKMVGQVAAANTKTCDPEVVSKAILAIYEPYNQGKPSSQGAGMNANKMSSNEDNTPPSLNTLAHSIHEIWEKQITSGNPKVENAQLLPVICQAISTSSTSGDPAMVAKAIESAYTKMAAN